MKFYVEIIILQRQDSARVLHRWRMPQKRPCEKYPWLQLPSLVCFANKRELEREKKKIEPINKSNAKIINNNWFENYGALTQCCMFFFSCCCLVGVKNWGWTEWVENREFCFWQRLVDVWWLLFAVTCRFVVAHFRNFISFHGGGLIHKYRHNSHILHSGIHFRISNFTIPKCNILMTLSHNIASISCKLFHNSWKYLLRRRISPILNEETENILRFSHMRSTTFHKKGKCRD